MPARCRTSTQFPRSPLLSLLQEWTSSEADFRDRILSEQRPVPDVAPQDSEAAMPRLILNRPLARTTHRRLSHEARTERMPRITMRAAACRAKARVSILEKCGVGERIHTVRRKELR